LLTVLASVTPVAGLALVGYLWDRLGYDYSIQFVTRLCMTLSVPCLIFTALMKTDVDPAALSKLSLAAIIAYGLVTLVSAAILRGVRLSQRVYLGAMVFGNTGNLGLPLALFAFGQTGMDYAVVVFAVMILWSFTFGVWVVAGGGHPGKALKEPVVAATVAGCVFLWQGWHLPAALTNTLSLAGQMAVPLLLVTLGVAVARLQPGGVSRAIWLSLAKAALCTAIAWGTGVALGLDRVALAVLVLQVASPVAVTSYMLAEKYNAEPHSVAGLVMVSTLLSVGLMPLLLALLL